MTSNPFHLRHHWKESANILVLTPSDEYYSVLTIKGNPNNNLLKRSYVTPGGTLDYSDFSYKWWTLFEKFGSNSDSLHKCLNTFQSKRPPIIADNLFQEELRRSPCDEEDFVSTDMALRIAAIRHLFVQTGILLVEATNKRDLTAETREKWRQNVSQSSENFFKMCDNLNLKPDICSLKEWWNWLTPSSVGRSPRFDTIYYICFINDVKVNKCQHWSSPQRLIEINEREGYLLSPPQVYEFSRLLNFRHIQEVETFATKRHKQGVERWIPVLSMYKNGAISVLPGDDLYPETVELVATKPVRVYPQSLEEIRKRSIHLNRMELRGTGCQVVVNTDMPFKHIRPLSYCYNWNYSDLIGAKL